MPGRGVPTHPGGGVGGARHGRVGRGRCGGPPTAPAHPRDEATAPGRGLAACSAALETRLQRQVMRADDFVASAQRSRMRCLCIMRPGSKREATKSMSDNVSPLRQPQTSADRAELTAEVAGLIVAALNLDVAAGEIDPDQPLYGEGLGLDSIDILEIALVVSKQYGVHLRADSDENERIFGSLRQLVDYISAHRTK